MPPLSLKLEIASTDVEKLEYVQLKAMTKAGCVGRVKKSRVHIEGAPPPPPCPIFAQVLELFQKGPQGVALPCHINVFSQEVFDSLPIGALFVDVSPFALSSMILLASIGGLDRVALDGGAGVEHLEEPGVEVGFIPGGLVVQS